MEKAHLPGVIAAAFLVLFAGTFAVSENLLGKTLSSALVQGSDAAHEDSMRAAVDSAAIVRSDSSKQILRLMAKIRESPRKVAPLPPDRIDRETLWLARCIFSETKRPEEMELVAWVVRNRVETRYRGKSTYREVVLDPYQFSAFNPGNRKRRFYTGLTPAHGSANWQKALAIAYVVRRAPAADRPFSLRTRHFYSEQSMVGRRHPEWSAGFAPVNPDRNYRIDARRFRFYEDIV